MSEKFKYWGLPEFLQASSTSRDVISKFDGVVSATRAKAGLSSGRKSATRAINGPEDRNRFIRYLQERGFITFRIGTYHLALLDNDDGYVESFVEFSISDGTVDMSAYGDLAEAQVVTDWVKETFGTLGAMIQTATAINDRGEVQFSGKYLTHEAARPALQEFYPWLGVTLEEYFKAYMESDDTVLVLFGPPGVGKSTFLRSLIMSGCYSTMLAYNREVVASPALISRFYRSNLSRILAYEDIDNYLKSREDGNTLMAPILNATEGVVKHADKKIVFSTNLPSTDRIDPALLRKGRCFDILQFRELTPDEAAAAAHAAGVTQKDWTLKSKWALSDALAQEVAEQQVVNRFGRKVGFL